jgi:hypothetical protein
VRDWRDQLHVRRLPVHTGGKRPDGEKNCNRMIYKALIKYKSARDAHIIILLRYKKWEQKWKQKCRKLTGLAKNKKPRNQLIYGVLSVVRSLVGFVNSTLMLPDEDSNLDKLNQNQLYCHYTIGQSCPSGVPPSKGVQK